MTELVQKGTLPTLEQLDDAGKAVVVNQTGNNYTLGVQSGAYVPGTDRLAVETDYNATQTIAPGGLTTFTSLTFHAPSVDRGESFALGTKGIQVLAGTVFAGSITVDVATGPSADTDLLIGLQTIPTENSAVEATLHYYALWDLFIRAGRNPYFVLPFTAADIPPGTWLVVTAAAIGASIDLDDFGGMDIYRVA